MQQRRHFIFAVTAYDLVSVNEGTGVSCVEKMTKQQILKTDSGLI